MRYETNDLSKETTNLEVTATSVTKGAINDLEDFDLDAQTRVSEPCYVTMTFRNAGPNPMEPGGIFGLIKAHNTAGDELNRLNLIGKFKKCNSDAPETLAVGQSYTDCGVYLTPRPARLSATLSSPSTSTRSEPRSPGSPSPTACLEPSLFAATRLQ